MFFSHPSAVSTLPRAPYSGQLRDHIFREGASSLRILLKSRGVSYRVYNSAITSQPGTYKPGLNNLANSILISGHMRNYVMAATASNFLTNGAHHKHSFLHLDNLGPRDQ